MENSNNDPKPQLNDATAANQPVTETAAQPEVQQVSADALPDLSAPTKPVEPAAAQPAPAAQPELKQVSADALPDLGSLTKTPEAPAAEAPTAGLPSLDSLSKPSETATPEQPKIIAVDDLVNHNPSAGPDIDNPDDIMNAIKKAKAESDDQARIEEIKAEEAKADPLDDLMKEFEERGFDTETLDGYDFEFDFGDGGARRRRKMGFLFSILMAGALIYGMVFTFQNIKFISPFDPKPVDMQTCHNGDRVPVTSQCPPIAARDEYIYNNGDYKDSKGESHTFPTTFSNKELAIKDARKRIYDIEFKLIVGEKYLPSEWQNWVNPNEDNNRNYYEFADERDKFIIEGTKVNKLRSRIFTAYSESWKWSAVFEQNLLEGTGLPSITLPAWVNATHAAATTVDIGSEVAGNQFQVKTLFNRTLADLYTWTAANAANRFTCNNGSPDYTSAGGVEYLKWQRMTGYQFIFSSDYLTPECTGAIVDLRTLYDTTTHGNNVKFPSVDFIRNNWAQDPLSSGLVATEENNWSILGVQQYAEYFVKHVPSASEFIPGQQNFDVSFASWVALQNPKGVVTWNGTTYRDGDEPWREAEGAIFAHLDKTVTEDSIINRYQGTGN